jgi:hypothetical protein
MININFGEWAYLRIEPNIGSGEFINAGIILKDDTGLYFEPILDESKCIFTFGKNGKVLFNIINECFHEISTSEFESFYETPLSISGIYISKITRACYEDRQNFLQAIKHNTIFGNNAYELTINKYMKTITRERELSHFINSVKENVCQVSKNYINYFDTVYSIVNSEYQIKYNFSTGSYVSNISYVKACPYINTMIKNTMYKMVELSILQTSKNSNKPDQYELILYKPSVKKYNSHYEEIMVKENEKIHIFGRDNGIAIFDAYSRDSTVEHLIRKIAS